MYSLPYGQVSERTKHIKNLMQKLTDFAQNPDAGSGEALGILSYIDSEFDAEEDDVFVCVARELLSGICEDGIIDESERALLANFSSVYENPVTDKSIESFDGKSFVLTGDFEIPGGKNAVKCAIEKAGGKVKGSVSRKTDYVIVGALGSDAWAYGGFGGKIKNALDLVLKGKSQVVIVSESAFLKSLEGKSEEASQLLSENLQRFAQQRENTRVVGSNFDGLTAGQQEVFDAVKAGKNVYLAGLGGTGKSFIVNKIVEWAKEAEKNIVVCAPTGIAALNVGGSTIHRVLGIRPEKTLVSNPNPWIADDSPLLACDLMIVDEISMCSLDLFDYLSAALNNAAKLRSRNGLGLCQLVVVGDFCQLPPVITSQERPILEEMYGHDIRGGYPFMGRYWSKWNFVNIELTEAIRQREVEFVAALNACRIGDTSGLRWIEKHAASEPEANAIILCGTNEQADDENRKRLNAIEKPLATYIAEIDGKVERSDYATSEKLDLKPGARVMALVNAFDESFMNGSLGTVLSCEDDAVRVKFDNGNVRTLSPHTWDITQPAFSGGKTKLEVIGTFRQIPLKLAYAITIHKAQGQTFDSALIYPRCWEPGQLYTALSRLTRIEGMYFAHHCPDNSLIASEDVVSFYEGHFCFTE